MRDTLEENRLRVQPKERFEAPEHMINLQKAIRELRAEATATRRGHRQITLNHCGPVTLMLFAFQKGGSLDDHKAAGVVTIQALQGELSIRSEDEEYKLLPNMMVVFAPNVHHSVLAVQASAMLLSVCLTNDEAKAIGQRPYDANLRGY